MASGEQFRNELWNKPFVTDPTGWKEARSYVLSVTNDALARNIPTAQADVELLGKFYGAAFVVTTSGYRAVSSEHIHPITGALIYDQKIFSRAWRDAKQGGLIDTRTEQNAETPEVRRAVLEIYQAGVIGTTVLLDTKLSESQHLFAASAVDGVTFAYVFDPKSRYAGRGLNAMPWAIGPASMLECYAEIAEGRALDPDLSYVRDLAKVFDVSPEAAVEVTTAFITEGGKSVAERIMCIAPRDDRVPEVLDQDYGSIALAHRVVDNPDVTRFCPSATSKWATALVEKAEAIAATMRLPKLGT